MALPTHGRAANYVGANGSVSIVATNAAVFVLTGVKLEIGSIATPFNRKTMAERLADCQRYYQQISVSSRFNAAAAGNNFNTTVAWKSMRIVPRDCVAIVGWRPR